MYQQVTSICKFLFHNNIETCPDRKHVTVQLIENEDKLTGDIQIDAVGSFMKDFCIRKFKYQVWNDSKTKLLVHCGENSTQNYFLYILNYDEMIQSITITAEVEDDPFLDDCTHYLCFVIKTDSRTLRNLFPKIKKFVKITAPKYPDIRMSFTSSESLWKENDTTDKCIKMLSEAVGDVLKYGSTLEFNNKTAGQLNSSNRLVVVDKMYNKMSRLLQNNSDDSN